MKRPALLFTAVGALGLVALLFFRRTEPPEPIYEGKPLSEWLKKNIPVYPENAPAMAAVRAIGSNAVPCLAEWLTDQPSPTFERIIGSAARIPWLGDSLADYYYRVKSETISPPTLAATGIRILDSEARSIVPLLIPRLTDHNPNIRLAVIGTIADFPNDAGPAILPLVKCFESYHDSLPPPPDANTDSKYPAVFAALSEIVESSTNSIIRKQIMDAFAKLGTNVIDLKPYLRLNDPDFEVRCAATNALNQMCPPIPANR